MFWLTIVTAIITFTIAIIFINITFIIILIIVNNKLGVNSSTSNKKSNDEVAYEVIRGDWGNGEERKNKLAQAGYDYDTIQKIVNKNLK